jgi:acyl-coenzyme A thioesterase PaaI-like protein
LSSSGSSNPGPPSAARLAEELGDRLPTAGSVPTAAYELAASVRRLVEAVVMTAVDDDELSQASRRIDAIADALANRQRPDALLLVRHPDGRIESLMQAAAGELNPQALPIEWVHRPTEPPPGTPPNPVEVTARCSFTAAHAGSPGRVHGGVLALALDEVTGVAVRAAGASGMTVALEVSLLGAVPFGRSVDIAARYTGTDGRKTFGTGEISVDGVTMVTAKGVYIADRR